MNRQAVPINHEHRRWEKIVFKNVTNVTSIRVLKKVRFNKNIFFELRTEGFGGLPRSWVVSVSPPSIGPQNSCPKRRAKIHFFFRPLNTRRLLFCVLQNVVASR
jgi:hypothetical protein